MTTHIIFISGVGDTRRRFYEVASRWLMSRTLRVHPYIFGWDRYDSDFETQFAELLEYIDSFDGERVCLVGISAGGTAALNALAARPHIAKVAFVSSPFQKYHYTNPLLLESIERAEKSFTSFDASAKQKLLIITGLRDQVVPTYLSRLDGVKRRRVFGLTHAMSIGVATLVTPRILKRFLRSP